MEHLHAPWRMEYIGGEKETGCLFCRVLDEPGRDIENLVVWRPPGAVVLLNRYPYTSGHLLVAPRAHTGRLDELDDDAANLLMTALRRSVSVLEAVLAPNGFNVGANLGRAAGAGIPQHVHFHAVPRWDGDTSFMPVLGEVTVVNEHLLRTAEKVHQGFVAAGLTDS